MKKGYKIFPIVLAALVAISAFSESGYQIVHGSETQESDAEGRTEIIDDFERGRVSNWSWSGGWKYDERVELEAVSFLFFVQMRFSTPFLAFRQGS